MSERSYGIIGTIVFHNIILLLLLLTFIGLPRVTPSEGGLLINFGDEELAGGDAEPALNDLQPAAAPPQRSADREEGLLTQDHEEAPAVKNVQTTKPAEVKKPEPEVVQEKPPQVNTRALYTSRGAGASTTTQGSSEGIYQGQGNMGSTQGSPESDNYTAGLGGSGIAFNLNGRSDLFLQKPEFSVYKEGVIVVEITVDRSGKVINATPGVRGSTLVDNVLYAAVRKAALESRFNEKSDAPERQIGTIRYVFRLE